MESFYELAKQIDVLVIFYIILGFTISGLITFIMEILHRIHKSIKKYKEKKSETSSKDDN